MKKALRPGGAALLGVIVPEHRTFVADAIDVGRLPDHQAAVIDARLHDADVVAHDEQDVGLLLLLLRLRLVGCSAQSGDGDQSCHAAQSSLPSLVPPVHCRCIDWKLGIDAWST